MNKGHSPADRGGTPPPLGWFAVAMLVGLLLWVLILKAGIQVIHLLAGKP